MNLAEPFQAALASAADLAAGARDRWWVIGSAAAALHGAETGPVRDIDLLMSARDAATLLRANGVEPKPGAPDERFRSRVFGIVPLDPLPLEVMGGLHLRAAAGWSPLRLRTRERVRIGDGEVFVPAAAELVRLFRRFGRDKDLARAAALENLEKE
jgi:hypothetical protein